MKAKEKQAFAEKFLETYLANGFASLPKTEIDLLVFHLLTQTEGYRDKSNYELANALKLPESRVKTLRLKSALKYREIDRKKILAAVVRRFVESEQFATFEGGKVEISLEDPVEKRELENFLKVRGQHAEYTLNTEVLRISPLRLFELIVENVEQPKYEFNRLVQKNISADTDTEGLLDDALTLQQKFTRFRKKAVNADTMRTLLGAAVGSL